MILRSQEALSLGMWFLAVVGVVLGRRGGRSVLALALLAFSPFITLALLAYGQEGVLRVYLFSLPWTAALAALALAPFPKLKTFGTPKPAQALATALWVPRSGSSNVDDTVIFDRKEADGVRQASGPGPSGPPTHRHGPGRASARRTRPRLPPGRAVADRSGRLAERSSDVGDTAISDPKKAEAASRAAACPAGRFGSPFSG